MKIERIVALLMILVLSSSVVIACNKKEEKIEIVILAAASLTDVTAELKKQYEKENPNVTLTFSYGSSGALQTQIQEGAPADVFMPAAQKQMNVLKDAGLMKNDSIKNLLENQIVLIVPADSNKDIKSFEDILLKADKIALGEPTSVPVGQYSEEIFKSMGILDEVKTKAVYGSDVRSVLSYVESGNVDCGVVYATDAITSKEVFVVASAPEGSHSKVIYPVGITASSKANKETQKFVDYLQTDEAQKIFEKYGFAATQ